MKFIPVLMMALTAGVAMAQALPGAEVEAVRSGIGEEALAPLPLKKTAPAAPASGTVPSPALAGGEMVSGTAAGDPFLVKNVVVTLSGTTGFDRDAALELAARQALPTVLASMGMPVSEAVRTVKNLGSCMSFVKSYKVVKESLIPVYTLTSDLTFNGPMLQKNFGGKMPAKPAASVATTRTGEGGSEVPPAEAPDMKHWVVKIEDYDPAQVDRVRVNLNRQPHTSAVYRLLTAGSAELLVDTPMDAVQVAKAAGKHVQVLELEIQLPSGMIETGNGNPAAWQGQDQPNAPSVPSAPRGPNAPADPNGGSY